MTSRNNFSNMLYRRPWWSDKSC